MATSPRTYRISDDVDAELKRLAKIHGGTDRALRALLEASDDPISWKAVAIDTAVKYPRQFKGPILKPKDRK